MKRVNLEYKKKMLKDWGRIKEHIKKREWDDARNIWRKYSGGCNYCTCNVCDDNCIAQKPCNIARKLMNNIFEIVWNERRDKNIGYMIRMCNEIIKWLKDEIENHGRK